MIIIEFLAKRNYDYHKFFGEVMLQIYIENLLPTSFVVWKPVQIVHMIIVQYCSK